MATDLSPVVLAQNREGETHFWGARTCDQGFENHILLKGNKLYFLFLFFTTGDQGEKENPMGELRVSKPCLNICVGESGDRLTPDSQRCWSSAQASRPPMFPRARCTVRAFGSRRDEMMATHCTVHGAKAEGIPDRGLKVREYELRKNSFSNTGNFGFGIQEHIDLGIRYDASMGACATWTTVRCRLGQPSASDKITQEAQNRLHGGQTQNQQRGGRALVPAEEVRRIIFLSK
ncbi:hypothetical protein GH733_003762 [Mirounga leonina]|nr:hypothetical protein GH733_003762 [Mirounga leonina]